MSEEEAQALQEAVKMVRQRNAVLESALKPFFEAYRIHKGNTVHEFKRRVTLSISMQDWENLEKVMEGVK